MRLNPVNPGGTMKKFIAALAVALFLMGGQAFAAGSYDSDGGHGGCSNQMKWEDT